ncbi:hypothetical protein BDA99DRAFT_523015 [Phascolomyces articulosus]|uniref:Uncharacterized protein n=1 Tax=Phascolomyces articulosus TaxID=60185 RepID=A0AAD5P995_9FUNG|nr:hypothetical protein BDA99DRAFT_523015 [Phascolomyces articulosus]
MKTHGKINSDENKSRQKNYLTAMSSIYYEECYHKLMKLSIKEVTHREVQGKKQPRLPYVGFQ